MNWGMERMSSDKMKQKKNLHIETNSNALKFFSELEEQLGRHQIDVV